VGRRQAIAAQGERVPRQPGHREVVHLDHRHVEPRQAERPTVHAIPEDDIERGLAMPSKEQAGGAHRPDRLFEAQASKISEAGARLRHVAREDFNVA
jgi:hypothetical protein